jgi:hypothetical protein
MKIITVPKTPEGVKYQKNVLKRNMQTKTSSSML